MYIPESLSEEHTRNYLIERTYKEIPVSDTEIDDVLIRHGATIIIDGVAISKENNTNRSNKTIQVIEEHNIIESIDKIRLPNKMFLYVTENAIIEPFLYGQPLYSNGNLPRLYKVRKGKRSLRRKVLAFASDKWVLSPYSMTAENYPIKTEHPLFKKEYRKVKVGKYYFRGDYSAFEEQFITMKLLG